MPESGERDWLLWGNRFSKGFWGSVCCSPRIFSRSSFSLFCSRGDKRTPLRLFFFRPCFFISFCEIFLLDFCSEFSPFLSFFLLCCEKIRELELELDEELDCESEKEGFEADFSEFCCLTSFFSGRNSCGFASFTCFCSKISIWSLGCFNSNVSGRKILISCDFAFVWNLGISEIGWSFDNMVRSSMFSFLTRNYGKWKKIYLLQMLSLQRFIELSGKISLENLFILLKNKKGCLLKIYYFLGIIEKVCFSWRKIIYKPEFN